jgi:hypothetical protein
VENYVSEVMVAPGDPIVMHVLLGAIPLHISQGKLLTAYQYQDNLAAAPETLNATDNPHCFGL